MAATGSTINANYMPGFDLLGIQINTSATSLAFTADQFDSPRAATVPRLGASDVWSAIIKGILNAPGRTTDSNLAEFTDAVELDRLPIRPMA